MIAIVDYGMGNLGSIANMLNRLEVENQITSNTKVIKEADKLILPGVGSFDAAITNLHSGELWATLNDEVILKKKPILGICLGMQLMGKRSEEGSLPGFGWIDADVVRFRFESPTTNLKVPHMGWNDVEFKKGTPLFDGFAEPPRFYFVHSYHVSCMDQSDIVARTSYGTEFVSAIATGNIFGIQFHPEKSHKFGKQLLRNFALI